MIYQTVVEGIKPEMLEGFFVGWPDHPGLEGHLQLLKQSSNVVIALDEHKRKVIGFITAISDGVLSAYIPFLEVLPEYQDQGIGKELIERMLKELNDLYMIDLCCDEDLIEYYEKFGMRKSNGMIFRNYQNQSGNLK
ncbi:GNAT family N-acetyltransferase [Desemzia sp. RIT804]|uniref:GNAT family N-acetyltransferase n=1 Tax=Desemzia sp. RIT 804 TaxID=2810209 RepID=UPI00195017D1|nr:GNAT family N-acetyltransferase [Desemzia sp. RIT 804]MBM6614962.1 GNAT family N-acetyltransferase [Desemzia sp. RIT 804]